MKKLFTRTLALLVLSLFSALNVTAQDVTFSGFATGWTSSIANAGLENECDLTVGTGTVAYGGTGYITASVSPSYILVSLPKTLTTTISRVDIEVTGNNSTAGKQGICAFSADKATWTNGNVFTLPVYTASTSVYSYTAPTGAKYFEAGRAASSTVLGGVTITAGGASVRFFSVKVWLKSAAPTITSFVAAGVTATISESTTPKTITAVLPYGTDLKTITPTVTIGGTATGYTPSGVQDFSSSAVTPRVYSATDGTSFANYSVTLTANPTASSAKDLSTVTIGGYTPVFNATTNTYSVILPKAASLTQAVSFTNSIASTADFTSGNTFNFSSLLTITVTAQDNSTKAYTLQAVNGIADIGYVTVDGTAGTTDTQVYPDLVSKGYFVQLISAASGSDITQFNNYDITILTESPGSTNALATAMSGLIGVKPFLSMKSFMYGKTGWPTGTGVNGSADLGANVLSCYLNHPIFSGVTFSGNTASILTSGITGNGVQGVTTPGSGTVMANLPSSSTAACIIEQNSVPAAKYLLIPISTANYNAVNASGLKLIENSISYLLESSVYTLPDLEISSFTVNSVAATIDNTAGTITAQLPMSTDLTALQPTIVLTGTSTTVSPVSGVATDFSNSYATPVNYTVTDGCNTKVYAVTISVNATGLSQSTLSHVYFDGKIIHNDAKWNLQVFDTTGRLLISSTKDINMSSNAKGVYIVKSNSGTLKIVL